MKYSQRDIVLVQFPFTDLSGSKLRPALIVSGSQVNQLKEFICIQITSRIFDDGLFYQIEDSDVTVPLKLKSGIRLHKFFTVNEMLVSKKIAELNFSSFENVMKKINDKVLKLFIRLISDSEILLQTNKTSIGTLLCLRGCYT